MAPSRLGLLEGAGTPGWWNLVLWVIYSCSKMPGAGCGTFHLHFDVVASPVSPTGHSAEAVVRCRRWPPYWSMGGQHESPWLAVFCALGDCWWQKLPRRAFLPPPPFRVRRGAIHCIRSRRRQSNRGAGQRFHERTLPKKLPWVAQRQPPKARTWCKESAVGSRAAPGYIYDTAFCFDSRLFADDTNDSG